MYAVIGLGYVGLGLAVALSKHFSVIGYDINAQRVTELNNFEDTHLQVSSDELKCSPVQYTHQIEDLKHATFYIVVVSTPALFYETPDLSMLISATESVAGLLKKGDIVVYESTVYPGTTEEICIPILEKISHLKAGDSFNVGYSPERINPGDAVHTLKNVTKVIAAQNEMTLDKMKKVYGAICDHLYPVSSIAVAEAIKILENTQRDVNIAVLNEFTKIMHALDLDMHEIIEGAKTKWSFAPFKPGLVGGHCISIDPHYLAFKAKRHGVQPDLILTARKINDGMTHFVIESLLKLLIKHQFSLENLKVGFLGVTYKENVKDVRNSLALKLLRDLKQYAFNCQTHDPLNPALKSKGIVLTPFEELSQLSVVIIAVGHDYYKEMGLNAIVAKCTQPCIIMDVAGIFVNEANLLNKAIYWHL